MTHSGATLRRSARSVVLHPAGDTHEDDFAEHATRCLNVVLAPSFTARLGGAVVPLDRERQRALPPHRPRR